MLKKLLLIAVSTSSLIVPQVAFAATGDTGSLSVSLTVASGCELALGNAAGTENGGTPTSTLGFGTVTVFGTGGQHPNDQSDGSVIAQTGGETAGGANTFTINCGTGNSELAPAITFNAGQNDDGDGQRFLINDTATIPYDLYQDSARGTPWTAGTAYPLTLDVSGQAAVPIYGTARNVAANGTVDGLYSDTVTLTLSY